MRLAVVPLLLVLVSPGLAQDAPDADWDDVRAAFAVGDFVAARDLTGRLAAFDAESDQSLYWRYRLAETPDAARTLRRALLDRETLAASARALLLRDAAWIAYADGDFDAALDLLSGVELDETETAASSGLLAGLTHAARGAGAASRDALAAVPPDDPDYPWARYRLGLLAHADGDPALAARYLEMAATAPDSPCRAEVLLAEWRLARENDPQRAVRTARELSHRFPDSLPAALVAELEQDLEDLQHGLAAPSDSTVAAPPPDVEPPGRYTLQYAAFSDRARALAFLDAWAPHVPGLAIVTVVDDRGGTLYKLRAGAYPGRAQAGDAAEDFADRHGLRPMPVQPTDGP